MVKEGKSGNVGMSQADIPGEIPPVKYNFEWHKNQCKRSGPEQETV